MGRRNLGRCFVVTNKPLVLYVPNTSIKIVPGTQVKLGRFSSDIWTVQHGWHSWGGNRPFCGWYFVRESDATVKPLQEPDLIDIYLVTTS